MCLTLPAEIIAVSQNKIDLLDLFGRKRFVERKFFPNLSIGDKVLLAADFIVEKLSEVEYSEYKKIFEK